MQFFNYKNINLLFILVFLPGIIYSQDEKLEKANSINNIKLEQKIQSIEKKEQSELDLRNVSTQIKDTIVFRNIQTRNFDADSKLTKNSVKQAKIKPSKTDFLKYQAPVNNDQKGILAAPGNDNICSAYVVPTDGTCTTSSGNTDATTDYYGGCVQSNHKTIFYKFEITAPNNYLTCNINATSGKEVEAILIGGTCVSPVLIESQCDISPVTFTFRDLSPGWYYLMFSTQPGSNELGPFQICFTQSTAPPLVTGPEQDCSGAIAVCDMSYTQPNSYTGFWNTDEIPNGQTCLLYGEHNSVWYIFTPQTAGNLAFTLSTVNDYDWAIYDITTTGCSGIPTATPVRCNYSGTPGNTGLSATGTNTSEGPSGIPWCTVLPITIGNTYALIVDNYTGDGIGYTLDFSGSTTSVADRPPATGAYPTMTAASASCTANTFTVDISEYIQCISIVKADFVLNNTTLSENHTANILTVEGINCTNSEITKQLVFTHNGSLTTGHYQLTLVASPNLADKCGNKIQNTSIVEFDYVQALTLSTSSTAICSGSSVTLTATGANGLNIYTINPGGVTDASDPDDGIFPGISPTITTTYTVSATLGTSCTRTSNSVTVDVQGNIVSYITPVTKTVCSFASPPTLTASATINGVACASCLYTWTTSNGHIASGTNTSAITVDAVGTYSVSVVTSNGCLSSNTPSATVSLASAGGGGGACDVLYVSPNGGGTGYSKSSPTTLSDAVSKAQCTNSIIKMQRGIYTLTDYIAVHSYVTIEGGYDSGYLLKYSDMTGDVNSTTIRRSNAGDSDVATECTAFKVDAGADQFRIQDLRIEMPGSTNVAGHAAASNKTNYAIKLGSGCTNYNIVRCYIDAGVGSAP